MSYPSLRIGKDVLAAEDEEDIPGVEDDAWLCWSCARATKTTFAHTDSAVRPTSACSTMCANASTVL